MSSRFRIGATGIPRLVLEMVGAEPYVAGLVIGGADTTGLISVLLPDFSYVTDTRTIVLPYGEFDSLLAEIDKRDGSHMQRACLRKNQSIMSSFVRQKVFRRDHFRCIATGAMMGDVALGVDHFMPRALGGEEVIGNYITMSRNINRQKADMHPNDFFGRAFADVIQSYLAGATMFDELERYAVKNGHWNLQN